MCALAAEKNSTRAVRKMPEFYEVSDIEGREDEAPGVQHCSDYCSMWADRLVLKRVIHWDAQNGTQDRWDQSVLLLGSICVNYCLKALSWSLLFLTFSLLGKKELSVRGHTCTLSWWALLNWSWAVWRPCHKKIYLLFLHTNEPCFFSRAAFLILAVFEDSSVSE